MTDTPDYVHKRDKSAAFKEYLENEYGHDLAKLIYDFVHTPKKDIEELNRQFDLVYTLVGGALDKMLRVNYKSHKMAIEHRGHVKRAYEARIARDSES